MMKMKTNKKIAGAAAMLLLSATMLGTSTFAWFTMNKEVRVTGMEVKAHAEEGLLINEVALASSNTWDDLATANTTPSLIALRPASTFDLATWWHANSKLSADEAGVENTSGTVVVNDNGDLYLQLSNAGNLGSGTTAYDLIAQNAAVGNEKAWTQVTYRDASFGSGTGSYENGEGFYVRYTYYLKSSGESDLVVPVDSLQAKVKATLNNANNTPASGTQSTNLDPSLRVGVSIPTSVGDTTTNGGGYKIFSPIPATGAAAEAAAGGATNVDYDVTTVVAGTSTQTVNNVVASAVGEYTAYTSFNTSAVTIPNVNSNGIPVYVYVWFEGEDTHCMSDNLTTLLDAYDIDVSFKDIAVY
jgi:hypothetical protein